MHVLYNEKWTFKGITNLFIGLKYCRYDVKQQTINLLKRSKCLKILVISVLIRNQDIYIFSFFQQNMMFFKEMFVICGYF